MNKTQALAKLKKLYSEADWKQVLWRENPKAPTAEEREEKRAAMQEIAPRVKEAREAMDEREKLLLRTDVKYQELRAEWKRLKDEHAQVQSGVYSHRIDFGSRFNIPGMGYSFHIEISGDNWQEIVDQAIAKKGKA